MSEWFGQAIRGFPRQFWFLWAATLINKLGGFVSVFLAIYLTVQRHFSQTQAGLVIGLFGVGGAIGTMAGGVLADRWGRRPTMLAAQFSASALMLTLGFTHPYWQILGVVVLLGFCSQAVRPAFAAMMVDVVPERDRVRAFSLNYWAVNLGFAFSAAAAGLAVKVDYLLLFAIDAGTTLITALITLTFLPETRPVRATATQGRARHRDGGLGTAVRDRVFVTYLLISLGGLVVIMQFLSTLPIAMTAEGLSAATYGWVIAINGVLIVVGQLFVPRLIAGHDSARVLSIAALVIGVGFGLVAFAHAAWFFAVTVLIWTVGEMLQAPPNAATIASLSPIAMRGRYQGLQALTLSAGIGLAPIAGGFTQEHLGNTALWLGCFLICVLVSLGHLAAGPSRRRRIGALATAPAADAPQPPGAATADRLRSRAGEDRTIAREGRVR